MPQRLSLPLLLAMAVAVALVSGLAYWQERNEAVAALDELASEQVVVARSLALALSKHADDRGILSQARQAARLLETPRELIILLHAPGGFFRPDGRAATAPALELALRESRAQARLTREEAAALELPPRMAVAGLSAVPLSSGTLGIAVVATAARVRDRDRRARTRLLTSVLTAVGLVLVFGGVAFRAQRKGLELKRELDIAAVLGERDERLERLGRAATLGTLAMGVAHEMSTPLGVIAMRADQLAGRTGEDERAQRAVKAIQEQTERLHQVVRGLLTLARGGTPPMTRVPLDRVVQEAAHLVEHRFARAGVGLTTDGTASAAVQGDQALLVQALVNLLLNACDASPQGGHVRVGISDQAPHVTMFVEDHGPGIADAIARRAAEPFLSTKPHGQGTGLGLAVTSEIVKGHRGQLALTHLEPHGTRAEIRLPATS